MSKSTRMARDFLKIGDNPKELAEQLSKKDKKLCLAVQDTFAKVRLYQSSDVMLSNNISKLKIQASNLEQEHQGFTDAIAKKTASTNELKKQIYIYKNNNGVQLKNTREELQKEAMFYTRLLVECQNEYRSINLENDVHHYGQRHSVLSLTMNDSIDDIEALEEESELITPSHELKNLYHVGKLLKEDEEPLLRAMRSAENARFTFTRKIRQLKYEISQL